MTITPTQLRANLYKILDQVIETQQPIEILRNGQVLKLTIASRKSRAKLVNLQAHPGTMQGDPDSFVEMDWSSSWDQGKDV